MKSSFILFKSFFLDKPIVQITNNSNSKVYYEVGKTHNIKCYIAGYPLPNVEWTFKKCSNYPQCEESYLNISVI